MSTAQRQDLVIGYFPDDFYLFSDEPPNLCVRVRMKPVEPVWKGFEAFRLRIGLTYFGCYIRTARLYFAPYGVLGLI